MFDLAQWFHKRLAYTRSVAVNSMVGYMVGLGDRHNNNMYVCNVAMLKYWRKNSFCVCSLLDMQTAEVVHIDLGVAFDIGKVCFFLCFLEETFHTFLIQIGVEDSRNCAFPSHQGSC